MPVFLRRERHPEPPRLPDGDAGLPGPELVLTVIVGTERECLAVEAPRALGILRRTATKSSLVIIGSTSFRSAITVAGIAVNLGPRTGLLGRLDDPQGIRRPGRGGRTSAARRASAGAQPTSTPRAWSSAWTAAASPAFSRIPVSTPAGVCSGGGHEGDRHAAPGGATSIQRPPTCGVGNRGVLEPQRSR